MNSMNEKINQAKILIVDDLSENLQVLGSTLTAEGYRVAFATSGNQAINIAQSKAPDLILLDIQMPEMDGYDTCKQLKFIPSTQNIPVIFLTAKNEITDLVAGFEIGAVDYITKPFNHTELLVRVSTHLKVKLFQDRIKRQNAELVESQEKIARDAQQLMQLNEELIESEQSLLESNRTKDKLFSIIAHDLRSPFAGILGLGELMVEEFDSINDNDKKSMVENLFQASKRLFSLVENLLIWSRSQMNRIEYNAQSQSIDAIVDKTVVYYNDMLKNKSISISNLIPNDTLAFCDKDMLSTVLRNLISNAIKFTREGGSIAISSETKADMVVIKVSDSGVGIEKDIIEKVFQIDQKVTTPGTNSEIGTGLGLMLCKEFVERQKGKIWIESQIGKGTDIYFSLPLSA